MTLMKIMKHLSCILLFAFLMSCQETKHDGYICRCLFLGTSCMHCNFLVEVTDNGFITTYAGNMPEGLDKKLSHNEELRIGKDTLVCDIHSKKSKRLQSKDLQELKILT